MITLTGNFGQYTFDEKNNRINSGQKFNHVFKGVNDRNEPVLVKKLLPALQNDHAAINRFRNEFDLRVQHEHIISATDYFIDNGAHYLIRNWINGKDLAQTLQNKNARESIAICSAVLHALSSLHSQHILHLDVQPKNIIIGTDQHAYLTDLGLARRLTDNGRRQPFNIYYSAPEQILNQQKLINTSTDLFAVGMILLELLSKSKFQRHSNPEILMNLVLASPVVNHQKINAPLFNIVKKATAKPRFNLPPAHYPAETLEQMIAASQALRYQNAQAFLSDLEQLDPKSMQHKKWWKVWQ